MKVKNIGMYGGKYFVEVEEGSFYFFGTIPEAENFMKEHDLEYPED